MEILFAEIAAVGQHAGGCERKAVLGAVADESRLFIRHEKQVREAVAVEITRAAEIAVCIYLLGVEKF